MIATPRQVLAGIGISLAMMAALLWLPAQLGAVSQGYHLDARALSRLAFAEMAGFLLGTLFVSSTALADLRNRAIIGCALVVGANLILVLLPRSALLLFLRPIAGVGSGVGFGYGLKLCSASARPTRSFGVFIASMSLVMITGFQSVAWLIEVLLESARLASDAALTVVVRIVFGSYATLAALAGIALLMQKRNSTDAGDYRAVRVEGGRLGFDVLVSLLAILLFFVGQGAVWTFLQVLGITHGYSVGGVANAMSLFAFMGIVGSLGAAALPSAVHRFIAIGVGLLLLYVGLYALYAPASLAWYAFGCAVAGFYWNFVLPLILGLLARADRTGKGSVLGGAMSSSGAAIGPLLAGFLIHGSDYRAVGWLAAMVCCAGFACVFWVEIHMHRVERKLG